jgi:hypothetical protein
MITVQDKDIWAVPTSMQLPEQPQQAETSYAARVNRILAPYQHCLQYHSGQAITDHQVIWEEYLAEKYLGRHEKSDT